MFYCVKQEKNQNTNSAIIFITAIVTSEKKCNTYIVYIFLLTFFEILKISPGTNIEHLASHKSCDS